MALSALMQRGSRRSAAASRGSRAALPDTATTYTTPAQRKPCQMTRVRIKTGSNCELAISVYPKFRYNAAGGGGWGTVKDQSDGTLALCFDPTALNIPDLNYKTGSIFGVPLPPPLNIAIKPLRLEGTMNPTSGIINLQFDADFYFSIGSLYKAKPLIVRTLLTTESAKGEKGLQAGQGTRSVNNTFTLVGVAVVERIGDWFLDTFLMAPTDVLAVMAAEFEFE